MMETESKRPEGKKEAAASKRGGGKEKERGS
jgi:hypothetical protein